MRYYCIKCKNTITKEEYDFSMKKFKMALCRSHQVSISSLNKKNKKITPEAKALGEELIKLGTPITWEQWDGFKHIDIAVVKKGVNIEVDGAHHNFSKKQALADLKRTYHSFKKGYLTLRIPNSLVRDQKTIKETASYIVQFLKEIEE